MYNKLTKHKLDGRPHSSSAWSKAAPLLAAILILSGFVPASTAEDAGMDDLQGVTPTSTSAATGMDVSLELGRFMLENGNVMIPGHLKMTLLCRTIDEARDTLKLDHFIEAYDEREWRPEEVERIFSAELVAYELILEGEAWKRSEEVLATESFHLPWQADAPLAFEGAMSLSLAPGLYRSAIEIVQSSRVESKDLNGASFESQSIVKSVVLLMGCDNEDDPAKEPLPGVGAICRYIEGASAPDVRPLVTSRGSTYFATLEMNTLAEFLGLPIGSGDNLCAEFPPTCEDCDDPPPCDTDPCGLPDPCDLNLCGPDPDPMPCTADDPSNICESLRCGLGDISPLYTEEACGPLDPPTAGASATIGATQPGTYVCSGTKRQIATGSVSATVGGGAVIPASVSASAEFEMLIAWDFACSYSMFAQAWGSDGTYRQVHVQAWQGGVYRDVGAPCNYDGILVISCETVNYQVLSDAYSGSGIAGPGGSGAGPVKMPTEVTICPAPGYSTVKALNRGAVVTTESAQDIDNWSCQSFGIHYNT